MNAILLTTLLIPALASETEATPAVPAEASLETTTPTDAKVQLFEIDAHTTGVYIPDHRAPLVDVWVQIPVGQWDEGLIDAGVLEAWVDQTNERPPRTRQPRRPSA